jgi:lipopolysaccharide biosynthesis regulator YciM
MTELLLLLLVPVAAWAGWWFARTSSRRGERKRNRALSNRYFQGLNYLLSEQPDKALQVFLKMAEVNRDTVETHLALGSLFRRRGEVDRAIRLHQNIISKRNLDEQQRTLALLELGEDYMRAGLFDRAERLFSELVEKEIQTPSALRNLLDIYQQEKEWEKALEIAARLERLEPSGLGPDMSQFCCELAEGELADDAPEAARKHLRGARRHDPESVRAEWIAAKIAQHGGGYSEAMDRLEHIAELDCDYLHDILEPYFAAAVQGSLMDRARAALQGWAENYDGISVGLKQAEFLLEEQGPKAAAAYLENRLAGRPSVRGLQRLLELRAAGDASARGAEEVIGAVTRGLLEAQSVYRCSHCGFSGHQHHWQCPSCRHWGSTRVIRGILGE